MDGFRHAAAAVDGKRVVNFPVQGSLNAANESLGELFRSRMKECNESRWSKSDQIFGFASSMMEERRELFFCLSVSVTTPEAAGSKLGFQRQASFPSLH